MSAQVYDIYVYGQQSEEGKHFVVYTSELDILQILNSKLGNNLKLARCGASTIIIGSIITGGAGTNDTDALYNNIRRYSPEQGFEEKAMLNYLLP